MYHSIYPSYISKVAAQWVCVSPSIILITSYFAISHGSMLQYSRYSLANIHITASLMSFVLSYASNLTHDETQFSHNKLARRTQQTNQGPRDARPKRGMKHARPSDAREWFTTMYFARSIAMVCTNHSHFRCISRGLCDQASKRWCGMPGLASLYAGLRRMVCSGP